MPRTSHPKVHILCETNPEQSSGCRRTNLWQIHEERMVRAQCGHRNALFYCSFGTTSVGTHCPHSPLSQPRARTDMENKRRYSGSTPPARALSLQQITKDINFIQQAPGSAIRNAHRNHELPPNILQQND